MIKKKCPICPKVIEGYNEKQVDYLMAQHNLAKHSDVNNPQPTESAPNCSDSGVVSNAKKTQVGDNLNKKPKGDISGRNKTNKEKV